MKTFGIFLVGALLIIAGVTFALIQIGISPTWIVIVDLVILGIAIASGASLTKRWGDNTKVEVDKD